MARILVVDDEEKIRTILRLMLQAAGHHIFEAGDGEAALAVLENEAIDLVISDVRMNQMDILWSLNGQEYPAETLRCYLKDK